MRVLTCTGPGPHGHFREGAIVEHCGGYGAEELQKATAFRVYEDPADLLAHIDEVGGRR